MYNIILPKVLLRCNKINSITIGFDISMCLHLVLVDIPLLYEMLQISPIYMFNFSRKHSYYLLLENYETFICFLIYLRYGI